MAARRSTRDEAAKDIARSGMVGDGVRSALEGVHADEECGRVSGWLAIGRRLVHAGFVWSPELSLDVCAREALRRTEAVEDGVGIVS